MLSPETRDTCIRALRAALDTMRNDIEFDSGWYAKGDWRGDIHRRNAACNIRELRRAIRELKPALFPSWMSDPARAIEAMMADPR